MSLVLERARASVATLATLVCKATDNFLSKLNIFIVLVTNLTLHFL